MFASSPKTLVDLHLPRACHAYTFNFTGSNVLYWSPTLAAQGLCDVQQPSSCLYNYTGGSYWYLEILLPLLRVILIESKGQLPFGGGGGGLALHLFSTFENMQGGLIFARQANLFGVHTLEPP